MRVLENGYVVRPLDIDNAKGLSEVHKACFLHHWEPQDFILFLQDSKFIAQGVFLANQSDPVGFILVRVVEDEAEIITIAVIPRHRKKGLALALLDAVIDELDERSVAELHLEVEEKNKAAINLYKESGFEIVGERKAYYRPAAGMPGANAIMMRLAIS